jgi:CRISPR-associated endonuclease/helicase Cas3
VNSYSHFFHTATGNAPYAYQQSLTALPCASRLINIPTGLGKTAAVVLAWLWNRVHLMSDQWPRRLVYCLPMRTLVEQTREEANKWIAALTDASLIKGEPPKVHILMGGENAIDWDLYPEKTPSSSAPRTCCSVAL